MSEFTPNATVDGQRVEAYYVERPDYYGPGEFIPSEAYEFADTFHVTFEDGTKDYVPEDEIETDDEDEEEDPEFIEIGSLEHLARLAWRDKDGYRDAQRYSREGVEAIVQEHRIEAEQRHNAAIEAGGYVDPFEGVADVDDTDPAVVGYDKIATVLLAAEHLIETHNSTGIDLSIFGGVSDMVDWALDYCGVAFNGSAAPKPSHW